MKNTESLTDTETFVLRHLENSWENVLRCTPAARERLHPDKNSSHKHVLQMIEEDKDNQKPVFTPGVPDFLAFNTEEYLFIEAKGEGDGLRHTQLRWLMDNKNLRTEICFTEDNKQISSKLSSEDVSSYTFGDLKHKKDGCKVSMDGGSATVEIPVSMAEMLGLEDGSQISWEVVDGYQAKLDSR
jgi:VRR-NUC domain.